MLMVTNKWTKGRTGDGEKECRRTSPKPVFFETGSRNWQDVFKRIFLLIRATRESQRIIVWKIGRDPPLKSRFGQEWRGDSNP